ncbi:MAG TPA: fibronectin type III domain-containing protein [Deltaproteobacteria bacterium]|nr:fibronectin type III domain-containing protein [Deltaproteobacteria bacterium]HQJ08207.1 fibronectin type III domain-containing protein [Deltaproteobacteria bacterium]
MAITFFAQFAYAAGVMVSWAENSESDLAGYRVYYGTASRDYESSLDAGDFTSIEIDGLTPGNTYYIAVTAYDDQGNESDFSDEVQVAIPADASEILPPGTDSGGGGGGGGCFISTSDYETFDFTGVSFLILGGIVLLGISSLLRKYTDR